MSLRACCLQIVIRESYPESYPNHASACHVFLLSFCHSKHKKILKDWKAAGLKNMGEPSPIPTILETLFLFCWGLPKVRTCIYIIHKSVRTYHCVPTYVRACKAAWVLKPTTGEVRPWWRRSTRPPSSRKMEKQRRTVTQHVTQHVKTWQDVARCASCFFPPAEGL